MSNKANIDLLIQQLAPDADTAWQWLRQLHEGGYQLLTIGTTAAFMTPGGYEIIAPQVVKGGVVWIACGSAGVQPNPPTFPDPVAALVWWQVEKTNHQVAEASWDDGVAKTAPTIPAAPPPSQMIQPVWQDPFVSGSVQQPTPAPSATQGKSAKPRKTLAELQYEEQLKKLGQP